MYEMVTTALSLGVIGKPGRRTFLIQGRDNANCITLKLEKEQVSALCDAIEAALDTLEEEIGPDPIEPKPTFILQNPVNPLFIVSDMRLGFDHSRELLFLQCDPFLEETEKSDEPDVKPVLFFVRRPPMRHLVTHGRSLLEGGRPSCDLCGNPKDTQHICPRLNGKHPRIA